MDQKRLVALDMDGVLTKHPSSWSYVHRHFGVDNSLNYAAYRSGKLSYPAFITEDVKLWLSKKNPIKGMEIMELMREIPLMDNLYAGLSELRKKGYHVAIVSGGISWLADRISEKFTFDKVYSNSIDMDS
ncbi:phosphoserine phosphatase, partial [mine drainage metagenome]